MYLIIVIPNSLSLINILLYAQYVKSFIQTIQVLLIIKNVFYVKLITNALFVYTIK